MKEQIEGRNRELFTKRPQSRLIPMVWEFNMNAKDNKNLKVYAQEKWIRFARISINKIYILLNIDEDGFSRLCEERQWTQKT